MNKTVDSIFQKNAEYIFAYYTKFSPWEEAKTFAKYIFQKDYWMDARVFCIHVLLLCSLSLNFYTINRVDEMKTGEMKYELLYRQFGHLKYLGNEMRYLDQLFQDKEKNKEEIERLRKIPIK